MQQRFLDSELFSNRQPPPPGGHFSGYAFVGPDYVYGAEGAREYAATTGKSIGGQEDGCYLSVATTSTGFTFETDYGGSCIVYYYQDEDDWAVSTSLVRLIEYLRTIGKPPRPNYASLASFSRSLTFKQFTSFNSIARGVKILPLRSFLVVDSCSRLKVLPHRRSTPPPTSYVDSLGEYLCKWRSRFHTVLTSDEVQFKFDLTGGRDSRASFSMLMSARKSLKEQGTVFTEPGIHCSSLGGDTRDLSIAREICDHYGLTLNGRHKPSSLPMRSHLEEYLGWRELSLGSYAAIYFRRGRQNPRVVEIGGGGAGNHRRTLEGYIGSDDIEVYIKRTKSRLENSLFEHEYEQEQRELFRSFSNRGVSEGNLLSEWWLQFRGRVHNGRPSRYRTHFQPFISQEIDDVRAKATLDQLRDGQINFDIINSSFADLLHFPYDDDSKQPSTSAIGRMINISHMSTDTTGRAWLGDNLNDSSEHFGDSGSMSSNSDNCLDLLEKDLESALADPFVSSFYPKSRLNQARDAMNAAKSRGKFKHALEGAWISPLLAAHEVSPNRGY